MTTQRTSAALEAARALIAARFAECTAALLAGSVVRGDATATSDLDIVIICDHPEAPFRESLYYDRWPVELFVHTHDSLRRFFAADAERRRPSLPMMVAESELLAGDAALVAQIKAEAEALLNAGPAPLSADEIIRLRYAITDLLGDFEGVTDATEQFFIAAELAHQTVDFILSFNRQWIGRGKWTARALHAYNPALADRLTHALHALLDTGNKQPLIDFVEIALAPAGGRLFAGYRLSAPPAE
ncbi:MAG: nucleotidyltransferase domain-containing protein [Anaerolineae bacterium]